MFSSLLNIVDSVLTLDEGCSRKDLLSGDQVTIDGNLNKSVSSRISGTASLACIHGANKSKKFFIIVGKHKLELQGNMDMSPKPLSMVCPTHKSIRITNDQNKHFEMRFNDSVSFSAWLPALGEALAESICSDVLIAQDASNRIVCSNMRRCIHTCELLTSPSKVYIRRVSEIYGIRRKLLEVMSTLRSNPCDVNIKDLRSLKELCLKHPELQVDPDMKFLLERMPSERYNSEDLQVILKDILYAESENGNMVCAQVYHGAAADSILQDATSTVASAVLVDACDSHSVDTLISVMTAGEPSVGSIVAQKAHFDLPLHSTVDASEGNLNAETTRAAVPVHKKSRIVLNGVEIQSSVRSPSSAGKALSKQIKIKSKFTTPSQQRKEVPRPKSKTKTPPPSMNILSDVKFQVTPPSVLELFSSPKPAPVPNSGASKLFTPVLSAPDKENMPFANKNITPAPQSSAFKKSASVNVVKPALTPSLIPIRAKSPVPSMSVVSEVDTPVEAPKSTEVVEIPVPAHDPLPAELSMHKSVAIDLIPEVLERRQSHFGSPMNSTTNMPFFSPTNHAAYIPDVASLFDDAVVYAVAARESKPTASLGEVQFMIKSPMMSFNKPKKGDHGTKEKKNAASGVKPSLIPAYEVPVSKVMPLSTHLATKASKLPVAVERMTVSAPVQPEQCPVSSAPAPTTPIAQNEPAVATITQALNEVEILSAPKSTEPSSPSVVCSTLAPVSVANKPQTPQTAAPSSAARESRGKKIGLTQSLMSPPAKALRARHFTPSKEVVGAAIVPTPRTPAQALTKSKLVNSPVMAPSSGHSSLTLVSDNSAEENKIEQREVPVSEKISSQSGSRSISVRRGVVAFIVLICAIFATKWSFGTNSVTPPPNITQRASPLPLVQDLLPVTLSSEPIITTTGVPQTNQKPVLQNMTGEISPNAVKSTPKSEKANGFEMRVRFESGSPQTPPPAVNSANPASPVSPRASPLPSQSHSLQRHSPSALRTHLRRLQRLLSVPVKIVRSLFDKALQKFDRIRRVLAE